MAIDVKQYGRVYKHITEAVNANFGKYTLPWKYGKTRDTMLKDALGEYNADSTYPIRLHESLSDITLRWCFDGYPQTEKEDITKIFHTLWQFHKRWMLMAEEHTANQIMTQMNKEATDCIANLCSGINETFDKRKEKVTDLFVAVMEHVVEIAKEEKDG